MLNWHNHAGQHAQYVLIGLFSQLQLAHSTPGSFHCTAVLPWACTSRREPASQPHDVLAPTQPMYVNLPHVVLLPTQPMYCQLEPMQGSVHTRHAWLLHTQGTLLLPAQQPHHHQQPVRHSSSSSSSTQQAAAAGNATALCSNSSGHSIFAQASWCCTRPQQPR
jgi:hypothetical protein